jgi:hypothetical protein
MATRGTGGLDDTPAPMSEVLLQVESRERTLWCAGEGARATGAGRSRCQAGSGGQDRPAGGGRWRRSVRAPSGQTGGWKRRP